MHNLFPEIPFIDPPDPVLPDQGDGDIYEGDEGDGDGDRVRWKWTGSRGGTETGMKPIRKKMKATPTSTAISMSMYPPDYSDD